MPSPRPCPDVRRRGWAWVRMGLGKVSELLDRLSASAAADDRRRLLRDRRHSRALLTSSSAGASVVAPSRTHEPPHRLGTACAGRSEEHTSELQSLMRISYAVFCLNK